MPVLALCNQRRQRKSPRMDCGRGAVPFHSGWCPSHSCECRNAFGAMPNPRVRGCRYLLAIARTFIVCAIKHNLHAAHGANDNNRTFGTMSYRLRNAAQEEVVNVPLPVRTNNNQIGAPFGCLIENCVCHVSDSYSGLRRKSRGT